MKISQLQLRSLIGEIIAEGRKKDPSASVKEFVKALKVVVKHAAATHDYLNELAEQCQDDRLLLTVASELEEAAGDISNSFIDGVGVDKLMNLEKLVKLAKTSSKEAKADRVSSDDGDPDHRNDAHIASLVRKKLERRRGMKFKGGRPVPPRGSRPKPPPFEG